MTPFDRPVRTSTDAVRDRRVALRRVGPARYPRFPYHPPRRYPELSAFEAQCDPTNHVYDAVRSILADLGLDRDNFGKPAWNPLRRFLTRGRRALIKPNWVLHSNPLDESIESLVTHTSLIRAAIDYLILALDGEGEIDVADAPLQGCDFEALVRRNAVGELMDRYRKRFPGITFSVLDLRRTVLRGHGGRITGLENQSEGAGDPRGYTLIDLGQDSLLAEVQNRSARFRVTMYDPRLMRTHHDRRKHEYLVANSVLSADFVLNLPKLKCHVKAGITGALKNVVGINGRKEYLPHHTNGSPATGGDQYRRASIVKPLLNRVSDDYWANLGRRATALNTLEALLMRVLHHASGRLDRDRLFDGGWSGNDTIPRTTLDLNHALYFYDPRARGLAADPVRNVLHVVDGVVAGEGYGPLRPAPKAAGVVLGGWNPLLVDTGGARLIGFDPLKVRLLRYGFRHAKSRLAVPVSSPMEVEILDDGEPTPLTRLSGLEFEIPEEWQDATA